MYMLDTSTLSVLMREEDELMARLLRLSRGQRVVTCPIVRGEVLFGINRLSEGKWKTRLIHKAVQAFSLVHCEPLPAGAGDEYARIKLERQRLGLGIAENDLWVAACALALDEVLVACDSDFSRIEGLKVENCIAH